MLGETQKRLALQAEVHPCVIELLFDVVEVVHRDTSSSW
jgi:hypothetical protein